MTKFQFSEATKEHIEDLIEQAKTGDLHIDEKNDLEQLLILEHIIRLAKAKAHKYIQSVLTINH